MVSVNKLSDKVSFLWPSECRIYEHFETNNAEGDTDNDTACEQTFGQGFFPVSQCIGLTIV